MSRFRYPITILFSAAMLFLYSCGNDSVDAPNVTTVKVPYQSFPFYKDFSALNVKDVTGSLTKLKAKYPGFLDFYLDTLAGFAFHRQYNDTNQLLNGFFTHKDYLGLMDTVNKAFPDTKNLDEQLKSSLQYIKYYDSTFELPQQVYYFVSGLNGYNVVYQNEKNIGIGLDFFLGRKFAPYASVGVPDYATIRNTPENIPVWVGNMLYEDKYPFVYEERNLLDMMIQKGKELYFLEKITPYLNDSTRLGYTAAQMKWSMEHEPMIYNFLIQNKLLFENDLQKIMRFVTDGPNTAGMPPESPGNIGSFIGWKIVVKYMENTKISLHQLLEMKDAQKILEGAKYKP